MAAQQQPIGIAVAGDGTVFVADSSNNVIRRIQRSGGAAGNVGTLAGDASKPFAMSPVDGNGTAAVILVPGALGLAGNTLYVRDGFGLVRTIDVGSGVVTTLAGTVGATVPRDGPRGAATIGSASIGMGGLACTADGGLIITERNLFNGAVRSIDATGLVTTIAASNQGLSAGVPGGTGVLSNTAFTTLASQGFLDRFAPFTSVAGAPDGSLVVSTRDGRIRRIAPNGSVFSVIGLVRAGNFDGTGSAADLLAGGTALLVDPSGVIYFGDKNNVRAVDATRTARLIAGGVGGEGQTNQQGVGAVDGTGATARFGGVPLGLARAPNGDLYVSDTLNSAIRRIDAAGTVSTFAGALRQRGTADGSATAARFTLPLDLSWAPDGSLWLLDGDRGASPTVRHIAPDGSVRTLPTVVQRLAIDPAGTIYVLNDNGDLASMDPASGALTVLVRAGGRLALGADPRLGFPSSAFAAIGIKQLVLISDDQLVKVTLP